MVLEKEMKLLLNSSKFLQSKDDAEAISENIPTEQELDIAIENTKFYLISLY